MERKSRKTPDAAVIADRLHSASIHLLRRLRREDDALGLSAARLSALSVVVFGGPLTIGELAAAEQVQPPTMTRLVAGLEKEDLLIRKHDSEDRRRVTVEATAEGKRVLETGRWRRVASLAAQLESLEARRLGVLAEAADVLLELLHRKTDDG